MPSVCILEMFIVGFLVDFYKKQQVYKSSIQVLILYLRELLIKKVYGTLLTSILTV